MRGVMKTVKSAKFSENHPKEYGKYVNVLIILNAMVKGFRESLLLIKEQQEKNVYGSSVGQPNTTASRVSA
jgi:hypothetical protein